MLTHTIFIFKPGNFILFILVEDYLMPDWFEARLVATMILLAADVEEMTHEYK